MIRVPTIRVYLRSGEALHLGRLAIGDWEVACTLGARGLVPASLKREGDKRTPIGVFPLRYGFFNPVALPDFPRDLAFPFVPLTDEMIWEEDGPHYNRLVLASGGERAGERLDRPRDEPLFDIAIPIGFNDAVVETGPRQRPFHPRCAARYGPGTSGCIGIPRDKLHDLVRRLEPGMVIEIGHAPGNEALHDHGPLELVRFSGLQPGPKLIVLGAVHGNEPCGPEAILRAIDACRAGRLSIRRGEVTFVPVANLKAYRRRSREGDRNLNRDLRDKIVPQDYEDRIGNRLCALLREHDVLLDIHSFQAQGRALRFRGAARQSRTGGAVPPSPGGG